MVHVIVFAANCQFTILYECIIIYATTAIIILRCSQHRAANPTGLICIQLIDSVKIVYARVPNALLRNILITLIIRCFYSVIRHKVLDKSRRGAL